MSSDVSLEFNSFFKDFCNEAREEAQRLVKCDMQSLALEGLSPQERVVKLVKMQDWISQEKLYLPRKEYFHLLSDTDNLKKFFAGRLIFYFQEEKINLREAIILKEREKFFAPLVMQAKTQLPPEPFCEAVENKPLPAVNYPLEEAIFEQVYPLCLPESEEIIAQFKKNHPSHGRTEKHYPTIVKGRMGQLNNDFNGMEDAQFYYLRHDRKALKVYFCRKCHMGHDALTCGSEMQKAVSVNAITEFLTCELLLLDERAVEKAQNMIHNDQILADILYGMVPNAENIEALNALIRKTKQDIEWGKPALLIKKDKTNTFDAIFHSTLDQFKNLLDSQPANRKYVYIRCLLRDLSHKKILAGRQGKVFSRYFDQLIQFLEDEWRYVKDIDPNDHLPFEDIISEKQADRTTLELQTSPDPKPYFPKVMAFTYDNTKVDNLHLVHKALLLLKAIPEETTLIVLREFVSGKEMSKPIPWLAPLGDLMVFTKEMAANEKIAFPYQQQWHIMVKWFVNPDGSSFNANSLKASRPNERAAKFMKAANLF